MTWLNQVASGRVEGESVEGERLESEGVEGERVRGLVGSRSAT